MISAYYNHGRWIAECNRCRWAIQVDRGFAYFRCGRMADGRDTGTGCGFEAQVQFPPDADEILKVLAVRSGVENCNWKPGETVADLRIENAIHGHPSGLDE